MEFPTTIIIWSDPNFLWAAIWIVLTPIFWMLMSRWEYRRRWLTRIFGCPYRACYILSVFIILFSMYRNISFREAVLTQRKWWFLRQNFLLWLGHMMVILGTVFVVSSFCVLGYIHTFLGDYFGLLMPERASQFPFNITDNPMYWGSAMVFMGYSLGCASQAGVMLSMLVIFMYKVTIMLESPFTDMIYRTIEDKGPEGKKT